MATDFETFKARLRRVVLILGVAQVLLGCLVGLIPPTAVHWFRGIVMAHIEFTANGVLMTVIGLLARELRLPRGVFHLWFWTLVVGTFANGGAGLVAAFSGQSSKLMPTLNQAFPPPGGANSALVSDLLLLSGVAIIAALLLTLIGLARADKQVT
jgi:hypothetical protein